ncbi:MAG: c-type cytochrome [Rhodomicrobium sp.]
MRNLRLGLAVAAFPLLCWNPAAAQNSCGYAFSVTGQKLFDDHCAGCHGPDGKGKGPLAGDQRNQPTDLTGIAKRNNGQFPADRVADIIRYGGGLPGHEKDQVMPVWGKVFSGECGPAFSRRAVVELNRYLEALQK